MMTVEKLAERVRGEFDEMPGLMLTLPQASRLFGLDPEVTRSVLARLVDAAYLKPMPNGALARAA